MNDQRIKSLCPKRTLSGLEFAMQAAGAEKRPSAGTSRESECRAYLVPGCCTLDGFADDTRRREGMAITQLAALSKLCVRTQNTRYQIILLDSSESKVLIQGGLFLPEFTEAILCGSSFGGSLLKSGWIGIDMRMEIFGEGRSIVTSPVRSVHIENEYNLHGPL